MKVNKHQIYMNIALEIAQLSKCIAWKVGCIGVNENGRVVVTGVNGSLPKQTNCCDVDFTDRSLHHGWSLVNEVHAEMNMISEIATSNVQFNTLTIYVTHSPCENCFKHLMSLNRNHKRIDKIIYNELYHRVDIDTLNRMKSTALNNNVTFHSLSEELVTDI